jgi:hypothetical protein
MLFEFQLGINARFTIITCSCVQFPNSYYYFLVLYILQPLVMDVRCYTIMTMRIINVLGGTKVGGAI